MNATIADEYLPEWYHANSLVFVSPLHNAWERKKFKKKFGCLIKSAEKELPDMLRMALGDCKEFVEERGVEVVRKEVGKEENLEGFEEGETRDEVEEGGL